MKKNWIVEASFQIIDSMPVEIIKEEEGEQLKEIIKRIPIDGEDIETYMTEQVQLSNDLTNFRFVVATRVAGLTQRFAPIRAGVEDEIKARGEKNTKDQLENKVNADPRCVIFAEAIDSGEEFATFLKNLNDTITERSSVLKAKSIHQHQLLKNL